MERYLIATNLADAAATIPLLYFYSIYYFLKLFSW